MNIKRLRTVAGFRTQSALADLLGISQAQLSEWESERYAFLRISSLIRLAKALHCSVDDLLAGVDPDYDRIRQNGAAVALSGPTSSAIAVVAEGDALPDGITGNEHEQERPELLRWLARPGDLGDPRAYGIQIRGDSMLPAYRPHMIAIVSPEQEVRDGDEVYAQLASGECLVRLLHMSGDAYLLQPYNPGPQSACGGTGRNRGDARNRVLASRAVDPTTAWGAGALTRSSIGSRFGFTSLGFRCSSAQHWSHAGCIQPGLRMRPGRPQ